MKVQLINLGRNKVNEIVYPADMKVLQRIINKHVLTTCWGCLHLARKIMNTLSFGAWT